MCGINGIFGLMPKEKLAAATRTMNQTLAHRGPDDEGIYTDESISLGHRRLSIIDLSAAGHQPMFSRDGRYVLVYNGEVYNFKSVREQLKDYPFRSNSDSEVILAAYEKWGVDCLQHLNGMFAFAIWDREAKQLFIARDRLGIKPLYYHIADDKFIFSSELRSLLATRLFKPSLNIDALQEYLCYQTVRAPGTILNEVFDLRPGHYIIVSDGEFAVRRWWQIGESSPRESSYTSYADTCANIKDILLKAVERRLISDVSLAAFLSGGIDSSAVVALMNTVSSEKVKTFNVSFGEREFDESSYATLIAKKFKTDHTEIRLTASDFLSELPNALSAMDHPSGDGPNTYVVSKATRAKGIKVALSGLGGDELFAGYSVFKQMHRLENENIFSAPLWLRKMTGSVYSNFRPGISSTKIKSLLSQPKISWQSGYPLSRKVFFENEVDLLLKPPHPHNPSDHHISEGQTNFCPPLFSKISVAEIQAYTQPVLVRDTDQMSMAHGLEVREPFLDYNLVNYVLGVPDEFKYPSTPKKLLVDSLGNLMPPEIANRKKMGFTFPWEKWLKKELYNFSTQRLKSFAERPFVNGNAVRDLRDNFYSGNPNFNWVRIWLLVVLENWLEKNNVESFS